MALHTSITCMKGVRIATPPTCFLAAAEENKDAMPMTETRVPGETLSTRFRSTTTMILRGISPVGTTSGLSCDTFAWRYVKRARVANRYSLVAVAIVEIRLGATGNKKQQITIRVPATDWTAPCSPLIITYGAASRSHLQLERLLIDVNALVWHHHEGLLACGAERVSATRDKRTLNQISLA